MRYQFFLITFAILWFSTSTQAVDPTELKPGLIATYSESVTGTNPATVTRLEPTVALILGPGESAHPRIRQTGLANWRGAINVTRPGKYVFAANLRGGHATVKVNGLVVLEGKADDQNRLIVGDEIALAGGVQPFEASFVGNQSQVRIELLWQGPGFVREPVPYQYLGHLPKDRPGRFLKDLELEHGRFKFEELACIRCHSPRPGDTMAQGLADRPGPNLTEIAKRAYPGWIDAWLADPTKLRRHTSMPKLFTDDPRGVAERFAVTQYLLSLSGGPLALQRQQLNPPDAIRQSFERGRVLYIVTGCAACHQEAKPQDNAGDDDRDPLQPEDYLYGVATTSGPAPKYLLGALGSKTRPDALAAYLQNPLKFNPAGRMPNMNLNQQEAMDLARYLCRVTDDNLNPVLPKTPGFSPFALARTVYRDYFGIKAKDELSEFEKLKPEQQWVQLGRKLVELKGCVECHTIEDQGQPLRAVKWYPSLDSIKQAGEAGCLANQADVAKVPVFALDSRESAALRAFLKDGLTGAGAPAPAYQARLSFRRFGCLNCHSRDGEGGINLELADQMRLLERAENADDIRPPLLTGVGHKARTSWLKSVLMGNGRARPWMQLRMPQYGEANIRFLPEALANLEGAVPDDNILKLPVNNQQITAGRQLVGKGGLGCISCHDMSGVANAGTRGPDLATINQRVRYEWYERWLHQPLRMAPGTRMPQAFVDGVSVLRTVLNGDPKAQAEAMWAYLSLGPGLPLPDGLEPPKGLIITVRDQPEVLRTFMPEAGSKAIAIGYPGGVNLAFSADECRLAYAWAGLFLDAAPVWNNRGGAPAKPLGPKFWTAAPTHPWGLTTNPQLPPDFLGRANHPAFGAPLPLEPARLYSGPRAVHFEGYSLNRQGQPTFRYTLNEGGTGAKLTIAETPWPMTTTIATGFRRHFEIEAPGGYHTWFLAGRSTRKPRLLTNQEPPQKFDLSTGTMLQAVSGLRVVLPGEGTSVVVLEANSAPEGTVWHFFQRQEGEWLVHLRLPENKRNWRATLDLLIWSLPRDDDNLIKDLNPNQP